MTESEIRWLGRMLPEAVDAGWQLGATGNEVVSPGATYLSVSHGEGNTDQPEVHLLLADGDALVQGWFNIADLLHAISACSDETPPEPVFSGNRTESGTVRSPDAQSDDGVIAGRGARIIELIKYCDKRFEQWQEAEDRVSDLEAEIADRESERADLRDRVERAEAAGARLRSIAAWLDAMYDPTPATSNYPMISEWICSTLNRGTPPPPTDGCDHPKVQSYIDAVAELRTELGRLYGERDSWKRTAEACEAGHGPDIQAKRQAFQELRDLLDENGFDEE